MSTSYLKKVALEVLKDLAMMRPSLFFQCLMCTSVLYSSRPQEDDIRKHAGTLVNHLRALVKHPRTPKKKNSRTLVNQKNIVPWQKTRKKSRRVAIQSSPSLLEQELAGTFV